MGEIVITTWHPDTCSCVVEYSWDRDSDPATRVHTPHRVVKACPIHQHFKDHHKHLTEVWSENRHKNTHRQKLAEGLGVDVSTITYSYDDKRILHLHHPDLTAPLVVPRQA